MLIRERERDEKTDHYFLVYSEKMLKFSRLLVSPSCREVTFFSHEKLVSFHNFLTAPDISYFTIIDNHFQFDKNTPTAQLLKIKSGISYYSYHWVIYDSCL